MDESKLEEARTTPTTLSKENQELLLKAVLDKGGNWEEVARDAGLGGAKEALLEFLRIGRDDDLERLFKNGKAETADQDKFDYSLVHPQNDMERLLMHCSLL